MNRIIYLFATVLILLSCENQKSDGNFATGVVFHDINGNGIRDNDEPGIAGVAVSNGREVVLTNSKGVYRVPVGDDNIISVIKPGNFEYPVNEKNLPQFYYIHKPGGSPELKFPGVSPTGDLPESVNFALLTGSDSDKFSIIVFSDPQPYSLTEVEYYDKGIVEELVGAEGYAFGITLGDLVGDRPDFFDPLNTATARIGVPWYNVMGNHDMNFDVDNPLFADESFESVYGPANFAFNQGKVHFIVLDNIIYPNDFTSSNYTGGFREDQFHFIHNTLKHVPEDHLVVINVHIPLFNERPFGETFLNEHRERLFRILKDRPYTFSMSGHTHTQRHHYFGADESWLRDEPHHHYNVGTASGDWWSGMKDENGIPNAVMRDGTPRGYNFIHFDGNQYIFDYKVAGSDSDYKMRLYGPKVVPRNSRYRGEFYVNFFQGCENSKVECRLNDAEEWTLMRYAMEQDPYISGLRYVWDSSLSIHDGVRPSNPSFCYHLWKYRIPTRLPAGENFINVRVTDTFGREFFDQYSFMVVDVE